MSFYKDVSPPLVNELFSRYGKNSNSFFSFYPGFRHFSAQIQGSSALQGYMDTGNAWVGACEPLAPADIQKELVETFFSAAKSHGRFAITLPVSEDFAAQCKKAGLTVFQIGSEPIFDLATWVETFPLPHEAMRTVRSLQNKGALVKEIDFKQITLPLLNQFEAIRQEWLAAKRLPPLDFLNRVEPWTLSGNKKYFSLQISNTILAFIAAIPFNDGKGWYLIDVLRKSDTPAGSIEFLLGETMKILRSQGAETVSLGVAPLAALESKNFENRHQKLFHLLNLSYRQGGGIYRFDSLYDFKMKFRPSRVLPVFLVAPKNASLFSISRSISKAYFPKGLLRAMAVAFARSCVALLGSESILKWIHPTLILRAAPKKVTETLQRSRVSLSAGLIWILAFFCFKPETVKQMAFSWQAWLSSASINTNLSLVFFPGFLHWDGAHLITNLICLLVLVLPFEVFLGSPFTLLLLTVGHFFSNLLTGLSFDAFHGLLNADFAQSIFNSQDVGASLSIFSVGGGLTQVLKRSFKILAAVTLGVLLVAVGTHDLLQINHIMALFLGALTTRFFLNREQIA